MYPLTENVASICHRAAKTKRNSQLKNDFIDQFTKPRIETTQRIILQLQAKWLGIILFFIGI